MNENNQIIETKFINTKNSSLAALFFILPLINIQIRRTSHLEPIVAIGSTLQISCNDQRVKMQFEIHQAFNVQVEESFQRALQMSISLITTVLNKYDRDKCLFCFILSLLCRMAFFLSECSLLKSNILFKVNGRTNTEQEEAPILNSW